MQIPADASGNFTLTIRVLHLSNDPNANNDQVSDSAPIQSFCDLNQDGVTDVADVQQMLNQALGLAPASGDLTNDGVVNVANVQRVINAAFNLGCPY